MRPLHLMAICSLALAACTPAEPEPAAGLQPTAPAPGVDPGPFAPEPPATVAEIQANPALREAWRVYCDEIRSMAFIMIYPPPPGQERISADVRKCEEIFGA